MISLTPNCRLPISCAIAVGIRIAESVHEKYGKTLVLTSVMDGTHSAGTLHGKGLAWDSRIKHLDGTEADISDKDRAVAEKIVADMRSACDYQFDIVLESDHIHYEYDPK